MLSSVAVVSDASTTTRDVPGIHVASSEHAILELGQDGEYFGGGNPFNAFAGSQTEPAPESHTALFKDLTNIPRSMLALTTCHANLGGERGPAYTCAGTGVGKTECPA